MVQFRVTAGRGQITADQHAVGAAKKRHGLQIPQVFLAAAGGTNDGMGQNEPEDCQCLEDFERRQVAAMEMERRMAAYLAGRSAGGWDAPLEDRKQETDR